jgi:hypothetical protein
MNTQTEKAYTFKSRPNPQYPKTLPKKIGGIPLNFPK